MNPSLVAAINAPISPSPRSPLLSHFLPSLPHRFSKSECLTRRRYRVSFPRNSAASSDQVSVSTQAKNSDVHGNKKELTGLQPIVEKMTPPVRLATSAVVLAASLATGYGLGLRLAGSRNIALGGAAVAGAAGGAVVYALNSAVPEVAAIGLHNYVAEFEDPAAVTKEDVEKIADRYGVNKGDEAFQAEICDIYCRYVTSVLPSEGQSLKGDEVAKIVKFKSALGIDEPDAAAMHMEIGRRIFRQRLETGEREGDAEQRRAFMRLVYVSALVFGDASSFLLPWKRVLKVTDAQVEIAIRENAKQLYAERLKLVGRDINVENLVDLRKAQLSFKLSDELAEDLFREHTRKVVIENISSALSILKSRTRATKSLASVVEELEKVLEFNNLLVSLKSHSEADQFARGIGPISLIGDESDFERRMDDLKLLYRAYVTDALSGGRIEDNKLAAMSQLRNILGLGKREAEAISIDVTSKAYRKRLANSVSSGDLEAQDSKAKYLQKLCEELHFDAQKAGSIHEEIYRQKLQQCVTDGELSDDNVASLLRLRVMLCIPQQTVEKAHAEICGTIFEKVVRDAISSGVDGYDAETRKSVRKAAHGLRLSRETAMSIASKSVRRVFTNYIRRARAAENRTESAKELKKMIAFNTLVVTEMVADIKGESSDKAPEEEPVQEKEVDGEDEEWGSIESLRKTRPDKEIAEKMGKPGQTEITLKDDLPDRDRIDLYKTYLLYCLTGEVTRIPFGAQITTKRDDSEYVLLNQLGGILGLTSKEIVNIHVGLAEQAFRQQAEVILADGQLTKARVEQLDELQKQVGLPQPQAEKVIKNITTTKMANAIETAVNQGRLNIKQIRELKEANVSLDSMIAVSLREKLFKKTVNDIFSSGTGEFDEIEVYQTIPSDLSIDVEKAKRVVHDLAQSRLSNSLIQAVALLRQRNAKGVVSSLNDLLACDKAVPAEPMSWEVSEELSDLYAIYSKSNPKPAQEKVSRLQYLLGIDDSNAAALREMEDEALSSAAEEGNFVF
ncbi:PREDICTED: protein TIC110, chloroplastic [Camelina sativa]|uniref:Protein TIC110, chloroplastic n=1 Tax=Camelina sativa TaxID=90675 RepID=A0ABM0XJJ8_CAMSA|nr:PREDICTED: protein TIC110, chloroplastic [Camelina sativa]